MAQQAAAPTQTAAPAPAPAPEAAPAPVAEVAPAPAPAPAPADSGAFPAEFSATPDSAAAPVDSTAAPADSATPVTASPDTSAAPADSAAPAAAVAAPADTVKADTVKADSVKKDTVVVAKVDSSAVKADSSAAKLDSALTPAEKKTTASRKRFFLGVFGAVTYNDFYDSKLGLSNLGKHASGYSIETSGQDDLMGNYWGVGANAGLGAMFMFTEMFGIHGELGVAYREGKGESDVTVTLTWDDKTKMRERASLGIEYSLRQVNMDIPVFFRFALPNIMYAEAGPMLSLSFYSRDKSYVSDDESKHKYREEDVCNFAEFDMAFGLGATRRIGSKYIEAGLRFVLCLTPLNDADDAPKTWQGQFNMTFWFL